MWTILDAAEFLDRNECYFSFNAISFYKVYFIDFWIKILGMLFVNDKQIFIEYFKSFLIL